MDPQRNPIEAQRKKPATYGRLSSRGRHGTQSSPSSLSQIPSKGAASSAVSRQRNPRLSPPHVGDSSRPQKALNSTDREQREHETDVTRKRSHKSAFGMEASPGLVDVSSARRFPQRLSAQELTRRLRGADTKDAKPIPLEAGSADLLETTSLAETQRGTGQNGAGAAKLSKDINARFPSINKRLETPPTRRRRLIDALAAEEANSARPGPSQSPGPSQRTGPSQEIGGSEHANENEHKYAQQGRPRFRTGTPLRRTDSDSSTLEKKKIKVTYSQSRSILQSSQESTTAESADYPPLLPDVDEPRKRQPSPIIDGGEDDESRTKIAIRSVHELRRAGANNRSSDEMDDLLSRIGAPGPSASTMRRNGLCELADKLQKKEFMNQFRDHASRDNIANGICDEKDAISGFLLATVFVIFLSSCPAPHMLQQLTKNRAGLWLSSLLDMQEDITAMATRKSANIPRATRGALANVKGTLLGMRIWHGYRLLHVSPRTMALQLLSMLAGLLDPHDVRVILDDAYASISKLRGYFAAHDSRDDVDYALTVCILEARSSSTAATGEAPAEAQREASEIAAFLRGMLQSWPKTHRDTDATLLRLAINTTNDEARAAAFRGGQLLSSLMRCVNAGFSAVQHAIHNSAFEGNIYDELLLILGIMINVLEHCPDARASPNANEIDRLAATWSESERSMEKDDSVETSKLGIAYSYLAIILGYLYLGHPELPAASGLLAAIQHFIKIYKTLNNKTAELESLVYNLTSRSR